jgi:hypothetical protein
MFTFSRRLPYSSIDWILQNYGADAAPQLLILQYEQTLAGQLTIDAEVENVSKLMWLRTFLSALFGEEIGLSARRLYSKCEKE